MSNSKTTPPVGMVTGQMVSNESLFPAVLAGTGREHCGTHGKGKGKECEVLVGPGPRHQHAGFFEPETAK